MRIVINGIGVAGPALGYWLSESGHDVLLIEEAPRLRTGGYIVDFWGIGYDIAERMGSSATSAPSAIKCARCASSIARGGSEAASMSRSSAG